MNLQVKDGLSFSELDFDWFSRNLCLILGDNGVGKSNLSEALLLAIFGETTKDIPQGEIVRDFCGVGEFTAIWQNSQHYYQVTRQFSPKEALYWFVDGEDKTSHGLKPTQELVNEAFGMDSKLFRSTVLYGQGQKEFFVNTADAAQKGLLENILRFHKYSDAQERTRPYIKRLVTAMTDGNNTLNSLQENLERITENIADLRQRKATEAQERKRRKTNLEEELKKWQPLDTKKLLKKVEQLEQLAQGADENAKTGQELLDKLHSIQLDLSAAKTEQNRASKDVEDTKTKLGATQTKVTSQIGEPCPYCKRALTKDCLEHYVTVLREQLSKQQGDLGRKSARVAQLVTDEANTKGELEPLLEATKAAATAHADLAQAKKELEKLAEDNLSRMAQASRIQEDIFELEKPSSTQDLLEKTQKDGRDAIARMKRIQDWLTVLEQERAKLEFWQTGFGNTGIKSLLLDKYEAFINNGINGYLEECTGGLIQAEFSTRKRLKSEELRDRISFTITIAGVKHDYKSYSGGQKTLINIATVFTLRDLAEQFVAFPLLILDETFRELDPQYSGAVLRVLQRLSQKYHIWVTSHNDAMRETIPDAIHVTMGGDRISQVGV